MTEWREKEWDEPGPDFGKVYYRPVGPLLPRRPALTGAERRAKKAAQRRIQAEMRAFLEQDDL